jgi:hypothetical protein
VRVLDWRLGVQEEGQESPQCCLCPVSGGALKKTTEAGLWCHATCMQWIPEVTVEDLNRMEPVSHIKAIQKERWDLNCSVCRQTPTPWAATFHAPSTDLLYLNHQWVGVGRSVVVLHEEMVVGSSHARWWLDFLTADRVE